MKNILKLIKLTIFLFIIAINLPKTVWAVCSILQSDGQHAIQMFDALGELLASEYECPKDVFAFRRLIQAKNLRLETTLVANRGFHNPNQGSFSMFEIVSGRLKLPNVTLAIVPGDLFFGHFTAVDANDRLVADQNPAKGSLMIEAMAWDFKKELFNFYELRGDGKQGQWFYRGDSIDITADNELLHRQPNPKNPDFGSRLRCSACHGSGGPIMKELSEPHNDWWEPTRKLDFAERQFDESLQDILENLVPANHLAKAVQQGIRKINQSTLFYKHVGSLSLQEQLRPLFCPVELNFMSDKIANEEKNTEVEIPLAFFMDSRMVSSHSKKGIFISRAHYEAALNAVGSHFPETSLPDADHAWLTPVKAKSDKIAIETLIKHGLIDIKFVAAVLDIDMTNPVFSSTRCELLKYLPPSVTSDWQDIFIKNLSKSHDLSAKQLGENLTDPHRTLEFYHKKSDRFLNLCKLKLNRNSEVEKMLQLLIQRRFEISASEISSNPRGKILEPGFRVIFPETKVSSLPGKLTLTSECEVIEN